MEENTNEDFDSTKKRMDNTNENFENSTNTANEFKEGWNKTTQSTDNKKLLAGLLGIFLGGLGIHKFILGYNKEGIILLAISVISIPLMCVFVGIITIYIAPVIGLIEGIIYLTKTDEEFYETYQVGRKPWF